MGNCLVLQENSFNVMMKTDEKIIDYRSPTKVHHHETISNNLVHPNAEYMVRVPVVPQPTKKKKTVRFSDDVVEEEIRRASQVVRIKLVISKQELQAVLGEGGVSVEDVISKVEKEPNTIKIERVDRDDGNMPFKGWLPALESIPEVN